MDITSLQSPADEEKLTFWQRYVDDSLLKTGQVTEAAIHGLDGGKWASSKNFNVSPSEVSRLLTCMTGDTSEAKQGGITVGGQNFIFMRSEGGRSVYGRKGVHAGVCAVKCNMVMLIGIYGAGIQPENCNAVILKLADYLLQHNL